MEYEVHIQSPIKNSDLYTHSLIPIEDSSKKDVEKKVKKLFENEYDVEIVSITKK